MEKKNTHVMYGFITGIVMVIVSLAIYLLGLEFKSGIQAVVYGIFLIGLIINAVAFSKANNSYVTFGNVFGSCFKASLIVTIVIIAWSVISLFVFPEMKDKVLANAHDKMIASNQKMTDEQLDMALSMTKKYYTTILISGAIFVTLFWGAIFSLIGALVAKKSPSQQVTADNF